MLGDTGNKRAVRILLECILVFYYILSIASESIVWIPEADRYFTSTTEPANLNDSLILTTPPPI